MQLGAADGPVWTSAIQDNNNLHSKQATCLTSSHRLSDCLGSVITQLKHIFLDNGLKENSRNVTIVVYFTQCIMPVW